MHVGVKSCTPLPSLQALLSPPPSPPPPPPPPLPLDLLPLLLAPAPATSNPTTTTLATLLLLLPMLPDGSDCVHGSALTLDEPEGIDPAGSLSFPSIAPSKK